MIKTVTSDDSDIELGDDESDADDEHVDADVQDAVGADDSQLDDDDGSSVLNADNDDDPTASMKPLHPSHAASMLAGFQSPHPARNDSAIAVVSRPWQVDQLAAKSRKAINSVIFSDSCLQLTPRFLFVHCTQNLGLVCTAAFI